MPGACLPDVRRVAGSLDGFRDAKVEDLRVPAMVDHDVARLDVAVNDAVPVRVVESVGDFARGLPDFRLREPLASELVAKRLAFDVLHRDVRDAVDVRGLVDHRNVRVRKLRCGDRLVHEAALRPLVGIRQNLQRHLPPQRRIFREKYFTHSPAAELTEDPVTANVRTDHLYVDMMHRIR